MMLNDKEITGNAINKREGRAGDNTPAQSTEANEKAFEEASSDITKDPDAPATDASADLDEGELARFENPQ